MDRCVTLLGVKDNLQINIEKAKRNKLKNIIIKRLIALIVGNPDRT